MPEGDAPSFVGDVASAMLGVLFTQSPVGLILLDPELRVVGFNTGTANMAGVRAEDILGRHMRDAYDLAEPDEVEAMARGVLDSGVPVREHIVRGRRGGDPSRLRDVEVSVFRLRSPQGQVLGLAVSVVDVTERERARARTRVLDSVRERAGRTLDISETCQALVDAVVPEFADIAVVDVVDAVIRGDEPQFAPVPPGTPLRCVAFGGSRGESPLPTPSGGDVRDFPAPTPYTQALADLRPRMALLDPAPPWLAADPAHSEMIRAYSARSLLTAPLAVRGAVLGSISLYRTRRRDPFDQDDIDLALAVTDHIALYLDNARRYTREHSIAATVQRYLLPRRPISRMALETAYVPMTSSGGGEWYDTIALSGARVAVVIGQVSGRGIHVTATMGQMRTAIRALTALDIGPDELLARLNDTVSYLAAERASLPPGDPLHHETLTASCLYALYDPLTRTCTIANAGHPAPLVVWPDGTTAEVPDLPAGPQLGSPDRTPFAATTFEVPVGSVLVLSNAPLLTAETPGGAGPLDEALARVDRPLQDLFDDVRYRLPADTMLLLVRTRPFPDDSVAVWHIDADPAAVARARGHVRDQLTRWNVGEEAAFSTEVIVSELLTNAVHYGGSPLELRLVKDRTLTCEVTDGSPAAPHLRHARTVDEGGRGLFIVAQLAQDWGTRYRIQGKTVWAEQALPLMPEGQPGSP
ncbi:SpoIIE family protein phosphatase [Streptomyces tubercidicus]|uniref:SpoIIE family protein phosphatase n=2 Tax=Streptomyces tubercidicus TaxID=47759 RepID=UPI0030E54043